MRATLLALAAIVPGAALRGQMADSLSHQFSVLRPEIVRALGVDAARCEKAPQLLAFLRALSREQSTQRALRVGVNAALTSDASPASESFDSEGPGDSGSFRRAEDHAVNIGLQLSRGTYPGELTLITEIGLSFDEQSGAFRENISRVRATYDHYLRPWLEAYVYFDRLSDGFLSIDQRYEGGLGIVLDGHPVDWLEKDRASGAALTARGARALAALDKNLVTLGGGLEDTPANQPPEWQDCYVAVAARLADVDLAADDRRAREFRQAAVRTVMGAVDTLKDEAKEAIESVRKRHSVLRTALLLGFTTDFEQASLRVRTAEDQTTTLPLLATRTYRLVVRPTVVVRVTDAVELRADWYRMYAVGGFRTAVREGIDDYREDVRIAGTVSGDVSGIGALGVTLEWRRLADNAPPFAGLVDGESTLAAETPAGLDLANNPLVARRRHDRLLLKVGLSF